MKLEIAVLLAARKVKLLALVNRLVTFEVTLT
jgi:hypothetical protein